MIFTIIVTVLVLQMVVAVVLRVAVAFRRRPKTAEVDSTVQSRTPVYFLHMTPGCAKGMGDGSVE